MSSIHPHPDLDRRWAFIIMISGCIAQVLTLGLSFSSAIFYTNLLDEFHQSPVFTAWTVNINISVFLLSGELAAILVGCLGTRKTIAFGCVFSSVGLFACCFARSLITIFLLFGIMGGIGNACCYFSTFDVIPKYFRRYRPIAFAVGSCGAGIGQFMYPALFRVSSDEYSPRGAFLILAGFNLHMLVIAAAFMPPRGAKCEKSPEEIGCVRRVRQQGRQQMYHFALLRKPKWSLWLLSSILSCIGVSGFLTHISNYARVSGHSDSASSFLPSIIGIAGLVGRLSMGSIVKLKCTHVIALTIVLSVMFGAANLLASIGANYSLLVLCCAICGFGQASFGICPEAAAHILGASNITAGVSYTCLAHGIGLLIGGPLAALLYEIDPSYRLSFVVVGIISFFGAFLNLASCCRVKHGGVALTPSVERIRNRQAKLLTDNAAESLY